MRKGLAALSILLAVSLEAAKFYPDDPLLREPEPQRVEKAKRRKLSDYYDFFWNTFARPGEKQAPKRMIRAGGVNTLDEVMDGAWYSNRHYYRRMSIQELLRGAGESNPPADGPWKLLTVKSEGITPGFVIEDSRGERYWLKFDPLTNPEMATAADVIGAKFFYALGYHVPEYYIVHFPRERLMLTPKSELRDKLGKRRAMTARDVGEVLLRVPKERDGSYRAVASRGIKGSELGPFRYHGTRKDDPNDIVPHEHRRDLRGLFVFCAWLGHDDSRAVNTIDFLVEEDGRRFVKHYLIDFGSILGSASEKANSARSGNEHLFAWKPAALQFVTLGLYLPRWARADYPTLPSVGRFEHKVFDPERYKSEYPNPAFYNRLPDDCFWAAKQLMAFTDEEIRAIVKAGRYSDQRAEEWIVKCLIERRNKIGRTYVTRVLPLDRFSVSGGRLTFVDLAAEHGIAASQPYSVQWSRFDNEAEKKTALAGRTSFDLPEEVRSAGEGEYFAADIRGSDAAKSLTVYLRKAAGGEEVVGVERHW